MSTPRVFGSIRRSLGGIAPALAAVVLMAGAAACTPSAAPTIPSLQSAGASSGATTTPEQAMRAYVACMRGHGIDMPDPVVQPGGGMGLSNPDVVDKGVFMTADQACRDLLVNAFPPTTPNPNAAQEQDQLLAYARCMREHGIQIEDPVNGGISVSVNAAVGPEAADPSFQAADTACAPLLPGKPGATPTPQ